MQSTLHAPRPAAVPGEKTPPAPLAPGRLSIVRSLRALTLVEVMVSLWLLATVMLAFISALLQSRRNTEANVLQAAATSMIYGIIEQIKQADYATQLPNGEVDPDATNPDGSTPAPPYIRVRINQSTIVWLRTVNTPVTDEDSATTIPAPKGPAVCPAISATATSVGAIDNSIGKVPLSTVTGTASQQINLNIWVWVDGIPNVSRDVSEMKKVTVVYTYSFLDGRVERFVRNSEVFLRSRFDQ